MPEHEPTGVTRRTALRGGLIAGGAAAVWAAPSITTLGSAALAVGTVPPGAQYVLSRAYATAPAQPVAGNFAFLQLAPPVVTVPGVPAPAPTGLTPLVRNGTVFGNPALPGLFGDYEANPDAIGFPLAAFNTSADDVRDSRGIVYPARTVAVHPALASPLVIRFTATVAGDYALLLSLADGHQGTGNGVTYALTTNAAGAPALPSGRVPEGSELVTVTASLRLAVGDRVDVAIGANGDKSGDTTLVDLALTQT